jgi:hypothetical protein
VVINAERIGSPYASHDCYSYGTVLTHNFPDRKSALRSEQPAPSISSAFPSSCPLLLMWNYFAYLRKWCVCNVQLLI